MPIPTIDDKRLLDLYKRLKPIVTIEELKVAKAIPTTDFTDVKSAKYCQKLSDIKLPSGYSWLNAETTLNIVADGQTFDAKYTPEDTDNYEVVYEQFTVNVSKADGVIEVADNQSFTYGDVINLNATTNNEDGKEITYDITGLDGETELDIEVLGNVVAKKIFDKKDAKLKCRRI